MERPPIASIINFCTNEARFLRPCIEQCRLFSQQIIVPVCDHFFDGTKENRQLLNQIYGSLSDVLFLEYPFLSGPSPAYLPSLSRLVGSQYLDEEIERVFFLDADEIPDGQRVLEWLETSDWSQHSVLKMANYWYFREPRYQSKLWEDSIIFVQAKTLEPALLLHERERDAIYDLLPGPKKRNVTGFDGAPLFHHYSWVRTKDEMLKKVKSWSHRDDRNWVSLVEEEFSSPFRGTDFIHGYSYSEVVPLFNISFDGELFPKQPGKGKVERISEEKLLKILGIKSFWKYLKAKIRQLRKRFKAQLLSIFRFF